jgi:exodeoxyribonuclease V alpha subunit
MPTSLLQGEETVLVVTKHKPGAQQACQQRIHAAANLIEPTQGCHRPLARLAGALGLMNDDVTVAFQGPAGASSEPPLRVAFPDGRGGIRWVPPSRPQAVETVFAMTVHKCQGSEFDHVALVLPEHPSPVLTRELVYTAITRAKHRFTLTLNSLNQSEKVNILRALLP